MVTDPLSLLPGLIEAKTDMLTFHYEAIGEEKLKATCESIIEKGIKAGVAISPGTEISPALQLCISESLISMVNVMTVKPGFGGQTFMESELTKVKELREKFPLLDIQVDGGVKSGNVGKAAEAGANVIVCGTGIIQAEDQKSYISELRALIDNARVPK